MKRYVFIGVFIGIAITVVSLCVWFTYNLSKAVGAHDIAIQQIVTYINQQIESGKMPAPTVEEKK